MRDHGLQSLAEVVAHYYAEQKPKTENELRWFRIQRKLHHAVRLAGLAEGPNKKRFVHQYRIPRKILQRSARSLLSKLRPISRCKSFDELLLLVEHTIGRIRGIGILTVYDTALRIGARLDLTPDLVYLHAGTRHGAAAIGFDPRRRSIARHELPPEIAELSAEAAEDILCLYARDLARILNGRRLTKKWS